MGAGRRVVARLRRRRLAHGRAGVLLRDRQVSKDGHEMHMAVNYLAPFLLTRSLLATISASAPARIINVASVAQTPIDFDDVMLERPGRGGQGYGKSKLALIMFTLDLAEELKGTGVVATALHPGAGALVRISPTRLVWWKGWSSGSAAVA